MVDERGPTIANDLLILLEVASSGTCAAAGAVLGVEHTTVSRRLTALEADLGSPVVVRTPRGCLLTDEPAWSVIR